MITIIAGTNRPGSNTRRVTSHLEEIYQELNIPFNVLDLAELPPEIFSAESYAQKPPAFRRFSQTILDSAGLHVVSPEYNGSVPGVLKYFIDMLKFPESFEHRPVCFVGVAAGIWGALRPVEQLQLIFGYRNAFVYPERVFIPKVTEELDENGRLKNPELVGRLRKQVRGFAQFVANLSGKSRHA